MKKVLFLLLIIPSLLSAQKIVKNEVDKFTNSKKIFTSRESIFGGTMKNPYKLWFDVYGSESTDKSKLIGLNFYTGVETSVFKGNTIIFLLENGERAEIAADNDYIIDHFYVSSIGVSVKIFGVSPTYYTHPNSEELKKIMNNKITDIRLNLRDSYVDYPINKKGDEKIKKSISLVLKEFD